MDVPGAVLEFVAGQLQVEDPWLVKAYTERRETPFEHQRDIRRVYGWKDFAAAEEEFVVWATARSWTSGDGPKAIFTDGVGWLRERRVLLPGVTTLARLVARVRDDTTKRLQGVLEGLLSDGQRRVLGQLLEVAPGARVSDLERWRKGVPPRASGASVVKALDQVAEIRGLGLADLGAEVLVPPRRLGEFAKYGVRADASALRRHPEGRRLAVLLATVRFLEGKSVDDALELLDLLMATELVNKARNACDKEKVRKHPKLAKSAARLAVAVEALFASEGWGAPAEVAVSAVWEAIDAVMPRAELGAALVAVNDNVARGDDGDPDDWRGELVGRYAAVSGFLRMLPEVITFGANTEGAPVLAAMLGLPEVLAHRSRLPAPLIPGRLIDTGVVNTPWKRLVFGHPARSDGAVDRHAYAFCVSGAVLARAEAPRDPRRRLHQVAQPAGRTVRGCAVGLDPPRCLVRAGSTRRPR